MTRHGLPSPYVVLVILITLSVVFLTFNLSTQIQVIKKFILYVILPPLDASKIALEFPSNIKNNLIETIKAREINKKLTKELYNLTTLKIEFDKLKEENERLRKILNFREKSPKSIIVSRVMIYDPKTFYHTLIIDKGLNDSIKKDFPVTAISEERLVLCGRVIEVMEKSSKVLLITDNLSAVSAAVEPSLADGLIEGKNSSMLSLIYLKEDASVSVGDEVFTAGIGEIFPKGILIGRIKSIKKEEMFKSCEVTPSATLNTLKEVLVIVER